MVGATLLYYMFFFRAFVKELRARQVPGNTELNVPGINPKVIRKVGWFTNDKKSSFVEFSKEKPSGAIRICAFGDSFTEGSEVGEDQDFPSLMQRQLELSGTDNVQVLNFGSPWWGFHQTYIMWNETGREYQCDFVILGPMTFYPKRDTSFNHTDFYSPYAIHARYILKSDDVELIDIIGEDHTERFNHYYRFIPHWRYVRYDRNAAAFFQAATPKGYTVRNHFYYYPGSMKDEAFATYRILLRKMAESGDSIIFSSYMTSEFADQEVAPNFMIFKPYRPRTFPYLMPRGHSSTLGNELLASQYLANILDKPRTDLWVLKTSDIQYPQREWRGGNPLPDQLPLSVFDEIQIDLKGNPVGYFETPSFLISDGSPSLFKGSGVVSLLAFKDPQDSILNGCFVSLGFDLQSDSEVVLRIDGGGSSEDRLGTVHLVAENLNLGVFELAGLRFQNQEAMIFFGNDQITGDRIRQGRTITIKVDGQPILRGRGGKPRVQLAPVHSVFRRLRADPNFHFYIDQLGPSGTFDLVLHLPDGGVFEIPLATWEKEKMTSPRSERPLEKRLAILDDGTAVVTR